MSTNSQLYFTNFQQFYGTFIVYGISRLVFVGPTVSHFEARKYVTIFENQSPVRTACCDLCRNRFKKVKLNGNRPLCENRLAIVYSFTKKSKCNKTFTEKNVSKLDSSTFYIFGKQKVMIEKKKTNNENNRQLKFKLPDFCCISHQFHG